MLIADWQLVGCCISGRNNFIGHNGLVGFIGLGLVSLVGFFDRISLVGPIGFIGLIGLGNLGITSLVGSLALSTRRLIGLIGFVIAAKISRRLKQAAALGVATVQLSATKIANAASTYYLIASLFHVHSLVRETMWWWLALAKKKVWRRIASFGDHGDVLQFGKQLFSVRLPLMTKFFVMRECDNILSGYLCAVTTVFSQQDGNYGFKFLTRFLEISCRDLTLFSLFSLLSLSLI